MEPVRLGVLGCGVIGSGAHLPDATRSPLLDVVAVADKIEERVKGAAERFGIPTTYRSGDELLEDKRVEAVVLAMPAVDRFPLALRALERGKHVLLEKPVARTVAEVEQIRARQGNRTVACCSPRFAFLPSARAAADVVASGALGDLRVVRARAILPAGKAPEKAPPPWRVSHTLNGGGILVNWGCYDLDYLMVITGWTLRPRTVLAQAWPLAPTLSARVALGSDAENHYMALIRCDGGVVISLERAEFAVADRDEAWQVMGTDGALSLWLHAGKQKRIVLHMADAGQGVQTRTVWEGDEDGRGMTQPILEDFARAIREGSSPQTSLERALVMQKITDALYASAKSGQAVEID